MMGEVDAVPGGPKRAVRSAIGVAALGDIVFGGWDIYDGSAYDAAVRSRVLNRDDLDAAAETLRAIVPMPAVFDPDWVRNIDGPNIKGLATKWEEALALMDDIEGFIHAQRCDRAVAVWCASTERYSKLAAVHESLDAFERGLRESHPGISPSMIYAYALLRQGVPIANGAPNLTLDVPALVELAEREKVPFAGKDFKTGQTLLKTVIAPALRARKIGLKGWYSTNILGNSDGHVLDDPGSFKSKEVSKLSAIESILSAEEHPELYGDITHKVRIDYYPPRGDEKEGWDNLDIFGWMGYPMQVKINFLCRDSILAAPLVLDLALLLDVAHRAGESGVQDWLSFYFKAPQPRGTAPVIHDLFRQEAHLFDKLREFGHRTGRLERS